MLTLDAETSGHSSSKTPMSTNGPDISRRSIFGSTIICGPPMRRHVLNAPGDAGDRTIAQAQGVAADCCDECSGLRMSSFDYNAPADLFPARSRSGHRPVGYRRFNTAAEAIRFAIEQMPSEFLDGTVMESRDERADGFRIKALYDSKDYPLLRKWRRVDLRNASGADLTFATRQPRAREANVKSKAPPAPNTC